MKGQELGPAPVFGQGQVPPPFRALSPTSEAPQPSARWLLGLLASSALPSPQHSLTRRLTGVTGRLSRALSQGQLPPPRAGEGLRIPAGPPPPPCPARLCPTQPPLSWLPARCVWTQRSLTARSWQGPSSPPGKGKADTGSWGPVLGAGAWGTSRLRQLIPPSLLPVDAVAPSLALPPGLVSGAMRRGSAQPWRRERGRASSQFIICSKGTE